MNDYLFQLMKKKKLQLLQYKWSPHKSHDNMQMAF